MRGFCDAQNAPPSQEQWDIIKSRISMVGTNVTEPDRLDEMIKKSFSMKHKTPIPEGPQNVIIKEHREKPISY